MSFKLDISPRMRSVAMLAGLALVTPALATPALANGENTGRAILAKHIAKNVVNEPQAEYAFTLTNDTSVDMLEFYASPQAAPEWETDFLGGKIIQANGDWMLITLSDSRGCIYDFLAIFADGDKLEKYGINVCELETHTYYED